MNQISSAPISAHLPTATSVPGSLARRVLTYTVLTWAALAVLGHWIFLAYILGALYPPLLLNGLGGLEGLHLPSGFRAGDTPGNLAAASHLLLAAVVIGGGPLQLIPAIRRRFPALHRATGRIYLTAAVITAVGGLWIVWTRGTVGDLLSHLTISGDALLILLCAAFALRYAIAGRLVEHRRWALRLFFVASAVWFFRVGLMGWIALTDGIGVDFDTFTGPFLVVLGFAQYLLPLAMLQWYFRCQSSLAGMPERWAFSAVLAGLTAYMAVGIVAATMGMWLPRM